MMTPQEKAFMDRYVRESFLNEYTGPAHREAENLGLTYQDFSWLYPVYKAVSNEDEWVDSLPPASEQRMPWASLPEFALRVGSMTRYYGITDVFGIPDAPKAQEEAEPSQDTSSEA